MHSLIGCFLTENTNTIEVKELEHFFDERIK